MFVKMDMSNQAAIHVHVGVQSPSKPQCSTLLIDIDLSKQAQFSGWHCKLLLDIKGARLLFKILKTKRKESKIYLCSKKFDG